MNLVSTQVAPPTGNAEIELFDAEQKSSEQTQGNMTMLNQCSTQRAVQMQSHAELTEQTVDARKNAEVLPEAPPQQVQQHQ